MSPKRYSTPDASNGNDGGVVRMNDNTFRRLSQANPSIGQQVNEIELATATEKSLTIRQAVRLYKRAICFSLIMSLAVVMEGYDLATTGTFMGYDAFRNSFGTELDPDGNPRISAAWQAAVLNGTQAGSIIGLWINGYLSEWIGYRKTMLLALFASAAFNFIHFFAQSIGMVTAGSVLMGLPWGIYQTLTVTYASDITPAVLRPYLTTYINLCWVSGQLVSSGVLRGCDTINNDWGWRIPFSLQWVWVPFICVGALMAPESPWWLVRKGRFNDARNSVRRLTTPSADIPFNLDGALALINHTNELEKAMNEGVGYRNCFRPIERRRTLIACVVWLTQALCGAALMGYSVQIFREAGLSGEDGLNMAIGQYALGFIGTLISWFLMSHIGRRALYFWGLCLLSCFLLVIGGLGVISQDNVGAAWALGSVLLVYTLVYNCTVGPVCYALVSEIPSTRAKVKTVVLARNVYNLGGIINNIIVPRMLSPTDWNWAGKSGFFFAGLTAILAAFMFFMLPECKGRTYAELDILFENKVPARKFHKTNVDQHAGHTTIADTQTRASSSDTVTGDSEKPRDVRKEVV
ncbi:hypothetical protein LTS08_000639 [Lithohypha guttulata]|nr:hypothetical protein LTS08_000639 [Lithohypha guttulata]